MNLFDSTRDHVCVCILQIVLNMVPKKIQLNDSFDVNIENIENIDVQKVISFDNIIQSYITNYRLLLTV